MNPLNHRGRDHSSQLSLACFWPGLLQRTRTCPQKLWQDQHCPVGVTSPSNGSGTEMPHSWACTSCGVRNPMEIASGCAPTTSTLKVEEEQGMGKVSWIPDHFLTVAVPFLHCIWCLLPPPKQMQAQNSHQCETGSDIFLPHSSIVPLSPAYRGRGKRENGSREKRLFFGQNEIQLGREGFCLFYLLACIAACTEIIFEILLKHLVWKENSFLFCFAFYYCYFFFWLNMLITFFQLVLTHGAFRDSG